ILQDANYLVLLTEYLAHIMNLVMEDSKKFQEIMGSLLEYVQNFQLIITKVELTRKIIVEDKIEQ
ncbi:21848_t:CDS:2, partial [Gigaspora margarita]